jgi:hypothetical protein
MLKRHLALSLGAVLVLGITGCGTTSCCNKCQTVRPAAPCCPPATAPAAIAVPAPVPPPPAVASFPAAYR